MAEKGTWVRIYKAILEEDENNEKFPDGEQKVPLGLWTKGILLEEGDIGDEVEIELANGNRERGRLIEIEPHYIRREAVFPGL